MKVTTTHQNQQNWLNDIRLPKLTLTVAFTLVGLLSHQLCLSAQTQVNTPLPLASANLTVPPPGETISQKIPVGEPLRIDTKEQISELENSWEAIYENYFDEDFSSLSLNPEQISEKLVQLQAETQQTAAVVWMTAQPDGLFLAVVTPNRPAIGRKITAADATALTEVMQAFRQRVSSPRNSAASYLESGQQLYQWLIAPIEEHLTAADIDTLILCVGPGLRSLPFAALHDGQRFLIEKYALTRIPGFNLTQWGLSDLRQANVLAMGASEFTEAQPLPGVAVELSRITPDPWEGTAVLNENFNLTTLQQLRQQQSAEIIHLATHAEFNPGSPSNSYIQFANERLNLAQMRDLGWQSPPVELLVLSACQTALGDVEAELGFVGLAVQSGVKSAMGSLWSVSDVGTLSLMSEFYWQLKAEALKAEALRKAQIAMIRGDVTVETGQLRSSRDISNLSEEFTDIGQVNLSHPYYWSGFTLIGNPF